MLIADLLAAMKRRWLLVALGIFLCESFAYRMGGGGYTFVTEAYTSTGKLLLRPFSARVHNFHQAMEVHPTESRSTELWFLDPPKARQILEDPEVMDKIRSQLSEPLRSERVEKLRSRILVTPSSIGFRELEANDDDEEVEGDSSLELEQLEGQGIYRRASLRLLNVEVQTDTPESAQELAKAVLHQLLDITRLKASQDYSTRRASLEALLHKYQQQESSAEKTLNKRLTQDPEEMEGRIRELERARSNLKGLIAQQNRIAEDIEADAAAVKAGLGGSEGSSNPVTKRASDLEVTYEKELLIYKPGSEHLQQTEAELRRAHALEQHEKERRTEALLHERHNVTAGQQALIDKLDREIAELREGLQLQRGNAGTSRLERAVLHWQTASLNLVKQVYRARILEKQAVSQGTLVVLQSPQPGSRIAFVNTQKTTLSIMLALFPVGLFTGTLLAVAVNQLYRTRALTARLETELGLPILAAVPSFSYSESRQWQAMKRRLTSARRRYGMHPDEGRYHG